MAEYQEKRAAPRTALPKDYIALARNAMEVHLVDLSLTGARIEHWGLLNPGAISASCASRRHLGT